MGIDVALVLLAVGLGVCVILVFRELRNGK